MMNLALPELPEAITFCFAFCFFVELISLEICASLGFVAVSEKKIFNILPCWLSPAVGLMLAMLM